MMKFFKNLLKKAHVHSYSKPIVSQYLSFLTRRIIYKCKCGARESRLVYRSYDADFPIPTTHLLSDKEFNEILFKSKYHG